MNLVAPSDPIVRLREAGEHVPDSLRSELLALVTSIKRGLIDLLEDEEAAEEDSPGEGWGPIHAVDLLVDLKAEEAIEPLLPKKASRKSVDAAPDVSAGIEQGRLLIAHLSLTQIL